MYLLQMSLHPKPTISQAWVMLKIVKKHVISVNKELTKCHPIINWWLLSGACFF